MIGMRVAQHNRVNIADSFMIKKRSKDRFTGIKGTIRETTAVNKHIFPAGKPH
jgi:hypothetical protein